MHTIRNFTLAIFVLGVCACKKNSSSTTTSTSLTFTATLSGANEVPANASTATGTATLTYNEAYKNFTIHVTYTGLTATGAHIRKGDMGVNGPIILEFTSFASPIDYTSPTLDATRAADLLANQYYVNIQSAAFPDGEIRGQLIRQ